MDWKKVTEELTPTLIRYATSLVGALVLFAVAWIAAGWISRAVGRAMERARIDITLTRFVTRLSRWLIVLLAILGCLGIFGVETTSFAAVMGAAGLAVGLAFQGTLSNFAAGIMLLLFRPFAVGDVVSAGGETGKVDAIGIFTTTLDTFDNRRFIVPNSQVFGSTIENISHHPERRADITVGTDYAADLDQTRSVLERAVADLPGVLQDPAPAIVLTGLGASTIDWSIRVWSKSSDYGSVREATIYAIKTKLDEAGIGIPFPQMQVHMDPPSA